MKSRSLKIRTESLLLEGSHEPASEHKYHVFAPSAETFHFLISNLVKIPLGEIVLKRKSQEAWVLSFWIEPHYQKQGYATEALSAVLYYVFSQKKTKVKEIHATFSQTNQASQRTLKKLGFKEKEAGKTHPQSAQETPHEQEQEEYYGEVGAYFLGQTWVLKSPAPEILKAQIKK